MNVLFAMSVHARQGLNPANELLIATRTLKPAPADANASDLA